MNIIEATIADAREIFDLQKAAFHQQALYYNNFNLKPLTETFDDYLRSFSEFTFLKATENNRIIGSVRAHLTQKTCLISRLLVHPDYQKNGIGSQLVLGIEKLFKSSSCRYELFTGERSFRSLSIYKNLGYTIFKRSDDHEVPLVFLEKKRIDDGDITFLIADCSNESHADVIKSLAREYFEWGNRISVDKYGFDFDIDKMFHGFVEELPMYSPPDGAICLVKCGSDCIGLGGFKRASEKTCELKRIYLREQFRGNQLGKKLLQALIQKAESYGYEEMQLESARFMRSGYYLYKSSGFNEIPIYQGVESPVEYQSIIYCMKKKLG